MTPERWEKVGELFDRALGLPERERAPFLETACAGDDELRSEVEELLAQNDRTEEFLAGAPPGAVPLRPRKARSKPVVPPEVEAARLDSDRVLGKYVLLRELGRGGFGIVRLAWDTELSREVAIKRLHAGADVERFRREATTVAGLTHPGIAQVYDVSEDPPYLAMQYVDGTTAGEREIPPKEAVRIVREAALAVAHAHERGIVHRDLKPANLMLDREGRVFVMDFGMARAVTGPESLTMTGAVLGTPAYMAPEQASGVRDVDARADVYGLGATLYTLLTRRPPFEGGDLLSILRSVVDREPVPLRRIAPRIDRDLETIVRKAMEKEPGRRYASAAALAADLGRWLDGEAIDARPTSVVYRVIRKTRRHPLPASLLAALVLLVGLGLGFWFTRPTRLRLTGAPPGVAVTVDGRAVDPKRDVDVGPGAHVLEAVGGDFEPWRREILLSRGQLREIRVDPRRLEGGIAVESDVSAATLTLVQNGAVVARLGTPTDAHLPTGTYRGIATARDHWSREMTVRIEPRRTAKLELFLPRAVLWRADLGNTPVRPVFVESPGGPVVVTGLHEGSLVALDAATGAVRGRWNAGESYIGNVVAGRFLERNRTDLCVVGLRGESLVFLRLPELSPITRLRVPVRGGRNAPIHEIAAGDLDGDGLDEVLHAAGNFEVLVVAGSAGIRFVVGTDRPIFRAEAFDSGDDGRGAVLLGTDMGIEILDGADGVRRFRTAPPGSHDFALLDVDRDCVRDVVFHEKGSGISAVSGRDGKRLWSRPLEHPEVPALVFGEAGSLAVYQPGAGSLRGLDPATGEIRWLERVPEDAVVPGGAILEDAGRPVLAYFDPGTREIVARDLGGGVFRWSVVGERFLFLVDGGNIAPGGMLAGDLTGVTLYDDRSVLLEDPEPQGVRASPVAADLDGDGRPEVIVEARGGNLRAYSMTRGLLFDVRSFVSAVTPSVVDLDGDGAPEVVVGSWDPNRSLSAFRAKDGSLLWRRPLEASLEGELATGDLDGDGRPEIVAATWEPRASIVAVDGRSGEVRWRQESSDAATRGPVLADLDGDGDPDVLSGSRDGVLHALDGRSGTVIWSRATGGEIRSRPLVAAGRVFVVSGDRLLSVSLAGEILGSAAVSGTRTDPAFLDLDGDGTPEVVVLDGKGILSTFDPPLRTRTTRVDLGEPGGRALGFGDFDFDGVPDVVVTLASGKVVVRSLRRNEEIRRIDAGGRIEGAPALGDFNGDGRLDIAVATVEGWLRVFDGKHLADGARHGE